MTTALWDLTIGAWRMRLLSSPGPRYTLVFSIISDPTGAVLGLWQSDR